MRSLLSLTNLYSWDTRLCPGEDIQDETNIGPGTQTVWDQALLDWTRLDRMQINLTYK